MKQFFVGALLLLAPSFAFAATFAQSPIFLSSTPAVEGEKVRVYVVVSNDTDVSFTGTVSITADGAKLGSPAVTLAAGAAQTVSVSWTPTAGDHTVVGQLVANDGTAGQQISQKFTVEKLPEPETTSPQQSKTVGGVETSANIQNSIGAVSPAAEKYTAPVFKVIDSGRVFAAEELAKAIDWSKQQISTSSKKVSPFVSAPSSSSTADTQKGTGLAGGAWNIFATVVLYVLSVLLYLVSHAGFFYPILAVAFFYILWRLWKRYRRR